MKIICLDTETTGLDRYDDEILQLSIVDGDGNVLFNKLCKPLLHDSWPSAQKIHGISPADVANCKHLLEYASEIEHILLDADIIVGYNLFRFDLPMLFHNGITRPFKTGVYLCDVMKEYAFINGEINERYGGFRFKKLIDCAKHYGYSCDSWHNALDDAKATLFCFYAICGNPPDLERIKIGKHLTEECDTIFETESAPATLPENNAAPLVFGNPRVPTWLYNFVRYFLDCIAWFFLFADLGSISRSEFLQIIFFSAIVFLSWRAARKCKRIVMARRKH